MQISIPIPSHAQLHGGGFEAGFLHPVLGFDHLLAMVAVGIISTIIGGRAIYLVPMSFVLVMFIGSLFGINGITFINDEIGIALSVIILGAFITLQRNVSLLTGMVLVAFFAFFHGHAHGVELPKVSSMVNYITGFMLATIFLHIAGVIIGVISARLKNGVYLLSHLGSMISGIGIYILYTLLGSHT